MVTDELISVIKSKFQQGERREDIKYSLMQQGWEGTDIEAAMSQIQHDALKQLPVLSSIYAFIDRMETKTAHSSPKMTFTILGSCFFIVLLVFLGLYLWLDPLGAKSGQRDVQRETDVVKLRNGLASYYAARSGYPQSLSNLAPDFLPSIPQDPATGASYTYKALDGTSNYTLCVNFETKAPTCVSASPGSSAIPVVNDQSQTDNATNMNQLPSAVPTVIVSPTVVQSSGSAKAL